MEYKHQQFVMVTRPFKADVGRTTTGHQPVSVQLSVGDILMVDDMSGRKDNVSFIIPSGDMGVVECGPEAMYDRLAPISEDNITAHVFIGMTNLVDAYAQRNKWDKTSREYLYGKIYNTLEGALK